MNGITYLRKSREDELREKSTGEDTLQIHRERLALLCENRNINSIERAEVVSGDSIAGRPWFTHILEVDIPSGLYDCIVVTEISRLGRGDMEDAGRIYKTLINYNIKIVTPNRTYDPTNPSDLRQLRFELFLSREEYEGIKERLWNNRNYRATQGYAGNNIVTLGFRQYRGNVEIIPEEASLVKEIFNMRAEEYSFGDIASYFNSRGLKTKRGTKYHASTINKIVKNPRYIGVHKWQGQEYQAKHPAIIDRETWATVSDINFERKVKRRCSKEDNPYLVELYCHECGSRMYGEMDEIAKVLKDGVRKVYKQFDIYVCSGKRKECKCTHRIHASAVHEQILKELRLLITDPRLLIELGKERDLKLNISGTGLNEELLNVAKSIKAKNMFLKKAEQDYEEGALSALLYTKHIEKVSSEIAAMENRTKKIKLELAKYSAKQSSPGELKKLLSSFLNEWDSHSNKAKKAVIRSFLSHVEIDKQGEFYISRNLPSSLKI